MGNLVDPDAFDARLGGFKTIEYGVSGPAAGPQAIPDARVAFDCSPQALYHKNFNLIADSFADFLAKGYRILILSDSARRTDRLRDIFADRGDDVRFTPVDRTLHQGSSTTPRRPASSPTTVIFDRFHKYNLKSDRARSGKLALSLKELNRSRRATT